MHAVGTTGIQWSRVPVSDTVGTDVPKIRDPNIGAVGHWFGFCSAAMLKPEQYVHPVLPVSFGRDAIIRWFLLSGNRFSEIKSSQWSLIFKQSMLLFLFQNTNIHCYITEDTISTTYWR